MVAVANGLLTDTQAAQLLNIKPQTLAVWRCKKRYDLPFVRVGRAIRYRQADIESWLASQTVRPEADE